MSRASEITSYAVAEREGLPDDRLYGGWDKVDDSVFKLLEAVLKSDDRHALYERIQVEENRNKEIRVTELKKRV